jgi:hypothetical protein
VILEGIRVSRITTKNRELDHPPPLSRLLIPLWDTMPRLETQRILNQRSLLEVENVYLRIILARTTYAERRLLRRSLVDSGILSTLAVVVVVTAAVLSSGCDSNAGYDQSSETTTGAKKTAIIRVTGTSGTPFQGSYGSAIASTESVEGEIPQDYEVTYTGPDGSFGSVTASMQKRVDDYSELTVQIIVDGETKKERSTAADFGVAKVSWHPSER